MIKKALIRYEDDGFPTINGMTAIKGFLELGIKTEPFYDNLSLDVNSETLVYGYISDVHVALRKLGKSIPAPIDYPKELTEFLGRKIWKSTLGEIRNNKQTVFIKPVIHKLFTGLVWDNARGCRLHLSRLSDDTICHVSEVVKFVSEYRGFILNGKLLDLRHYNGDWYAPPSKTIVDAAVRAWKGPASGSVDFGVTNEGKTLVVECNDGFSLGCYGLPGLPYARMLEARWDELVR